MTDHPNIQAIPNDSDGERSRWYRSGQALLILVLGVALAIAAMALFLHGVGIYNHDNNGPPVSTHPPASTQVHNP